MESNVRCQREVVLSNRTGIHLRAAGLIVDTAKKFSSKIRVRNKNKEADCKSVMDLILLEALPGALLVLTAEGEDAEQAVSSLEELINGRFAEDRE